MPTIPRLLKNNLVQAAASVLSASSWQAAFPYTNLRDQLRSKTWLTKVGWTVTAGVNDKIDFKEGISARVGTIAAGYDATGADKATAVQTAMNTAPGHTNTYTVTYDSATHKFTIARATGTDAVELLFATGANFATSVHHDLGFADTDLTGSTSYTGGTAVYQSRHFVGVDLGSAMSMSAAVAINHNLGAGGSIVLRRSATSVADAVANQAGSQVTLAGDAAIRIAFFGPFSRRYWALVIDNTTNTAGYTEIGIWYLGAESTLTFCYSVNFVKRRTPLNVVETGDFGAHFVDSKPVRREWSLEWLEVPESDRAILEAIDAEAPMGINLFLAFDPTGAPTDTVYGFFSAAQEQRFVAGNYYTIPVSFSEALD